MKKRLMDSEDEQEIDLLEIVQDLWKRRFFILKVIGIFVCIGIFIALVSKKEYTASCIVVPQNSEKGTTGGLNGLAAMAGINLGNVGNGDVLSPKIYSKILTSIPFQKELMQTSVVFEEIGHPVKLYDFYTKKEYRKNSVWGTITKYTIGLPGTIIGMFRSDAAEIKLPVDNGEARIEMLTKDEKNVVEILRNSVGLFVNDKEGYVQMSATMSEPLAAAQLLQKVQELLQHYITLFKIEKVQSNLDFVQQRFDEAKGNFENRQKILAKFKDTNQELSSELARTEEEKLENEYNLAFALYSELAKQLEQAKIRVKETTPVFTIIEPVVVPIERAAPKRAMICVAFTFLGGFVGVVLVLLEPIVYQISGKKYLDRSLFKKKSIPASE